MNFAADCGPHSGRATPSLRDARNRHLGKTTGRRSTYLSPIPVQTNPASSPARLIGVEMLMVLEYQAFIDDSYHDDGEFVLAGHIAAVDKWAAFAREWERLLPFGTLAEDGTYHFKMAEMAQTPERLERIKPFYRLIEETVDVSVSCRLNRAEFEAAKHNVTELFLREARSHIDFNIYGSPYYLLFRGLLYGVAAKREE